MSVSVDLSGIIVLKIVRDIKARFDAQGLRREVGHEWLVIRRAKCGEVDSPYRCVFTVCS